MVYFKKFLRRDVTEKYGFDSIGVFNTEFIKKSEIIWTCDLDSCEYLRSRALKLGKTRDELAELMKNDSNLKDFIHRYIDMRGDDLYDIPTHKCNYICECAFFNHSCEPNVGFNKGSSNFLVALRDIQLNEELTIDYQFLYTEPSFLKVNNCNCGAKNCQGSLLYDQYRNVDWQKKNYNYACKKLFCYYRVFIFYV